MIIFLFFEKIKNFLFSSFVFMTGLTTSYCLPDETVPDLHGLEHSLDNLILATYLVIFINFASTFWLWLTIGLKYTKLTQYTFFKNIADLHDSMDPIHLKNLRIYLITFLVVGQLILTGNILGIYFGFKLILKLFCESFK